ncbi:putative sulfate exporter family transporter [Albimonas sp. CAU 1670]|uniref:YeiH family protein n=1 Tax=Albimonas sp. CAU 1670 TaxID=3032599 RepID=UPI0023DCE1CC|nr:putative sulfate exporter family transporter [Albimonas sp. CAU 1670]MDF2231353.1 putative sulfate exporter family transporter [Albimonas sp. CAU 1670]
MFRAPTRSVPSRPSHCWLGLLPGLGLAALLAAAATAAQGLSGIAALSPMALAMAAGIAIRNGIGLPEGASPGLAFAMRPVLRAGIVLLGFRLTLGDLAALGVPALGAVAATLAATFLFTKAAGRALGVEPRLAELIAAGTSVCGASAILAVNAVTRARDEDVAYAIACVTVFGTAAMLLTPLLAGPLGFAGAEFGLWVGATVHEVAQAVGAAFAGGEAAGQAGTVAKLARVMMLAPLVLALGALAARRGDRAGGARAPMPWFVLGFVAAAGVNSAVAIPPGLSAAVGQGAGFLLTLALAAMGLETRLGRLRAMGLRPLALGAAAWVFILALGGALVALVGA